jgi:hypothetical protein
MNRLRVDVTLELSKLEDQLSPDMVSAAKTRALPPLRACFATFKSNPTLHSLHLLTFPFYAYTPLHEIHDCALARNEVRKQSWQHIQQERPSPCPSSSVQLLTYFSSPLRSNMSSANRGAGPSRSNNKRARDDGPSSSGALPPSSRK